MRLGIDFGTTRIVAAAADRGNFPLVPFESPDATVDWFPPLVAIRGAERRYGWDAWPLQTEPGWTVIRSIKRYLAGAGPHTCLEAGGTSTPLIVLVTGLAASLRQALLAHFGSKEPLEVMLGVPANAASNQRFLTTEAFRRAGFDVLGLLNEPSAASIEYGHRRKAGRTGDARVLVYDLGGGTFDVSLVALGDQEHTVLATAGIPNLGGDDFDRILAEMALGEERLASLDPAALFRLEEECRRQKESLHPNSRRITVDLDVVEEGLGQAVIPVADFYARCQEPLQASVQAALSLADQSEVETLYITGGGSELPLVARRLKEEFGRKVKRSEHTRSATAIGLAIQADAQSGYRLREVFSRDFGVWREDDAGRQVVFDPIFAAGTRLPAAGDEPLRVTREYAPVHNIGHFRYIEASNRRPLAAAGGITAWDDILFPFDPALAGEMDLTRFPVAHSDAAPSQRIQEVYTCEASGAPVVIIRNLTAGYERTYRLGRWSEKPAVMKPSAGPARGRARPQAKTSGS
jgi:molecular chaperone DnaK (HSP70)